MVLTYLESEEENPFRLLLVMLFPRNETKRKSWESQLILIFLPSFPALSLN